MIVTCEECSTSFQLDESRIPTSGARVRCSRCKHAFFLPNPSSSQSQAIESVVAETVQGRASRTPTPTRDLGRAAPSDRSAAEPEEEDWQFSEEIRVEGDDDGNDLEREHASSPDPSSFDLTGDFGRGFDPDVLASPEPVARPASSAPGASARSKQAEGGGKAAAPTRPAPVAPAPMAKPAEPARDESSFGSIDDFSSLIDDDDSGLELATESSSASHPSSPRREKAPTDDLGDPESWDLVSGDEKRHARSTVAALVRGAKPGPRQDERNGAFDLFEESDPAPLLDARGDVSAAPQIWGRVGRFVGWCVTLASIAAVGGALVRSEWSRQVEVPQRIEIGPLIAETTRSGWLESSRSGFLLVFEGELRNSGSTPRSPAPLRLAFLDGAGQRLAAPSIPAGQRLAESVLREARPEELEPARVAAIAGWLAAPIAPGEVRPFAAILPASELPNEARRILLESGPADSP